MIATHEDIGAELNRLRQRIAELESGEEVLRSNVEQFRSVLDTSIDVIYRVNAQTGRFEYVSPSAETTMGYTPEEYIAMSSEDVLAMIHPDDIPVMRSAVACLLEDGKAEAVYRQLTRSGEYRWLSNHMSLVRDRTGQVLYRNGNIRDITELKHAGENLRESEERFRAVHENSADRFTILKPVRNGEGEIVDFTYVYLNVKAASTAGRSKDELVGQCLTEVFPAFCETRFFAICKLAMDTGQAAELEDRYNAYGVDDWFRITVTPVQDGIAVAAQIITERKRAEEALIESEKRFQELFNSITEVFQVIELVYDENGHAVDFYFREVNPATKNLTGKSRDEMVGKRAKELFSFVEDY